MTADVTTKAAVIAAAGSNAAFIACLSFPASISAGSGSLGSTSPIGHGCVDGSGSRLGSGGVNGADGDVLSARSDGPFGLPGSVRAETDPESGSEFRELGNVSVAGVEEIFLAQVAKWRACFRRNFRMVIDDQPDSSARGDRQDCFGHSADLVRSGVLGAKLNEVGATVAELLSHLASKQIFLIAGRNVLIEREVHFSDVSLNASEFDSERAAAPLKAAPDAYLLDTSDMDADAAFAAALAFIASKGFRSAGP